MSVATAAMPNYAALIAKEHEALLKDLDALRAYAEDTSVTSGIPYELQSSVSNHLNTIRDLKSLAVKDVVGKAVPTTKVKTPKVLTQYIDKIDAFDDFMQSDKTTLYVFLTEERDKESRETLGEVTHPDCKNFSWSCTIHCDGKVYFNGTPEKPTKHVYYLKAGEEDKATKEGAQRLYMGPDHFLDKYESRDTFLQTNAQKAAMYEDFFALGEGVLFLLGVNGADKGVAADLAHIKKRPAVTLYSAPGEEPVCLPAVGYAEGEEVPADVVIYNFNDKDTPYIEFIKKKYSDTNIFPREVQVGRDEKALTELQPSKNTVLSSNTAITTMEDKIKAIKSAVPHHTMVIIGKDKTGKDVLPSLEKARKQSEFPAVNYYTPSNVVDDSVPKTFVPTFTVFHLLEGDEILAKELEKKFGAKIAYFA